MSKRICIFGDSITHGHNDEDTGGWADLLKRFFWSKENRHMDVSVYPLGISGNTTEDILQRFDVETKAREPEVIILYIGINDTVFTKSGGVEVGEETFRANFKALVEKAKQYTQSIVALGLNDVIDEMLQPFPWSSTGKCYSKDRVILFDKIIHDVCNEEEVSYIDMKNVITEQDLPDGLHPNAEGHQKIFERVKDFLIEKEIV